MDAKAILTDLHEASSTAFDIAIAGMGDTLSAMAEASQAQARAIDSVIAATEKALASFDGEER